MTLEGRTALVTGGGRGIGRAVALALAQDGADVAVNYRRDEASARETVELVESSGRRSAAYPASVASWDDCERMVEAVQGDLGIVDIFVHSAGIASRGQSIVETDREEVERLWRVHAFGAFMLSQLLVPAMRTRARSDVVLVSSVAGAAFPANSAPYNMAKASMEALAFTLAKEERGQGIHVNVVAPGLVDTEMGRRLVRATMGVEDIRTLDESFPFGRVCRPEDVAAVVRFLVSEQAEYLTGLRVPVDAGSSASSAGLA